MASVVLMVGLADFDLQAFANSIASSGAHRLTISQPPSGSTKLMPTRAQDTLMNIKAGDALYVVAHGNGESWGSASATGVSVGAELMIEFFEAKLQKSVEVFLCICESWKSGVTLKKSRPDLTIWAARGTPKLQWNKDKKIVEDSTNKFAEV
jgi:hypothetical protein